MKTLTKILIILGIFIFAFVAMMVVLFWKFQAIPDTLVTCVLGAGTAELVATAVIEIVKKKCEVKNGEDRTDY